MTYAETSRHAHYVTVRDGTRFGLLLGPYPTHKAAEADVDTARQIALGFNADAWFYDYGTTRVTLKPGAVPPSGQLNARMQALRTQLEVVA